MITEHLEALSSKRIVLASKSPRRQELLKLFGFPHFDVRPSSFKENLNPAKFACAAEYATQTAYMKIVDVLEELEESQSTADLVVSADTVVELDGHVLEKPESDEDAFVKLTNLSGKRHNVYTGVVIALPKVRDPVASPQGFISRFWCGTEVLFDSLSSETIRAYIATGEPMDKAGGYGIQGYGGAFIKEISGCYFNVMGLPLNKLANELRTLIHDGKLLD